MYYDLKLPIEMIFEYCLDQVHRQRKVKKNPRQGVLFSMPDYSEDEMFGVEGDMHYKSLFPMWFHYLRLCVELGWTDYTPTRFTTRYNEALEASGLDPIIYTPYIQYGVQYFGRRGNCYICKGHFPCDDEGNPILRWTSIRVSNAMQISFSGQRSQSGTLEIEITPKTTIHLYGYDNYVTDDQESDDEWHQIYAGPLNMEFNYQALKAHRKAAGMTQKEVADAVGANVRTYQKWESKDSVPDGHYLLRIMNWLQIEDVQDLISYTTPEEE
jgi:DNA-binding transcriptional regulator YiaG